VPDRIAAVHAYLQALGTTDENAARAVGDTLADDVVVETNFGQAHDRAAAIGLLGEPRTAGFLANGAQWSAPAADGDRIVVTATLPETAPFGGIEFVFQFAAGKIIRVEQQTLPAAPLQPRPVRLTPQMSSAVNGALDNQTPMLIAYLDARGQIHLSFRGTIQAYGDDQLALWARDPDGGLPRNIEARPNVTLFYHDPATRTSYTFYGRARVATEPDARASIFENSHPREQRSDFRRRGVAIEVDLDRVEGRDPGGRFLMVRAQP
jgi:Pyridoxamine 5'-phosphate oxidase